MKFFLPDSQDLVDPSFDFERERRSPTRLRHRDDAYAHEVMPSRAYDGILVSKGIVDGFSDTGSRYSIGQRCRLMRTGVRQFFRVGHLPREQMPFMGDCGAFTYVKEPEPPFTVDQVLEFYGDCEFDYGISVDHVILDYQPSYDDDSAPEPLRRRQTLTLELAAEFLAKCKARKLRLKPLGVAQGWSPRSYAHSVRELQRMGYDYIALGGMVPLKTPEILACLQAIDSVRVPATRFHLLGVTRTDHVEQFTSLGVASFDSTSPLRQAFKDDKNNYYTPDRAFTAIRIPQVSENTRLKRRIASGEVCQETAFRLERQALAAMKEFAAGKRPVDDTLPALAEYETFCLSEDHTASYRATLEAAPWRECRCEICRELGHHVILFRGAERNRRRGFHNIWVFYRRLRRELGLGEPEVIRPEQISPSIPAPCEEDTDGARTPPAGT